MGERAGDGEGETGRDGEERKYFLNKTPYSKTY